MNNDITAIFQAVAAGDLHDFRTDNKPVALVVDNLSSFGWNVANLLATVEDGIGW